jgi:hypothetical protein
MALRSDSELVATFKEAMVQWDRQKAEGVPLLERVGFLANILRLAWPKGRETDWKYLCNACSDYGLEMHDCPGDATCGRGKPHLPHDFGRPCWCSNGAKFRAKTRTPEDFAEAGRTSKPTRLGR